MTTSLSNRSPIFRAIRFVMGYALSITLACLIAPIAGEVSAATLLPNGEQVFLSNNGDPLAGGSVFYYVPSTSTPKSTYMDSGASILNSNPVILDAAGRAIIYGVGTYRQVVKDAAGSTIWDQLTTDTSAGAQVWGGTSSGSGNAQTLSTGSFTQTDGQVVIFRAGFSNTGAMTLTPAGSTAIPVVRDTIAGPVALTGNEVIVNNIIETVYDASAGDFHLVNSQVFAGYSVSTTGPVSIGTVVNYAGQITPTVLAGNTNDWNPTGLQTATVIRASANTAVNLTGVTAPTTNASGRLLVIENVGSFTITLTSQDAASAAANRFAIALPVTLQPNTSASFTYDTTTSNWRQSSSPAVADYQVFTVTGTWTKPAFGANAMVTIMCWGGGGGGGTQANGGGGGGGTAVPYQSTLGSLSSTVAVTVATAAAANGFGGSTTFGSLLTAFGGGPGAAGNTSPGSGAGLYAAGNNASAGGAPLGGANASPGGDSTYGGGGASNAAGVQSGSSVWGGGGGAIGNAAGNGGNAGNSWYGGGGGGSHASGTAGPPGTSVIGGNGGADGVAGAAPGGGGGRNAAGGRGECRVWTMPG